jgi:hypothetical protein
MQPCQPRRKLSANENRNLKAESAWCVNMESVARQHREDEAKMKISENIEGEKKSAKGDGGGA